MKFGFITHPANIEQMKLLKVVEEIQGFFPHVKVENKNSKFKNVIDLITLSNIRSLNGNTCEGKIKCLPLLPHEIIENHSIVVKRIIEIAKELEDWGAEIIGLGGAIGIIGERGKMVQDSLSNSKVTTGNSFTVYTSLVAMKNILDRLGMNLQKLKVVIIGFPGSIGLAIARILAKKGISLILVGRRDTTYMQEIVTMLNHSSKLKVEVCNNIKEGVAKGKIIFSATSTGQIINQKILLPGSIVIDIAEPKDVIGTVPERSDVLIIDGGRFNIKNEVSAEGFLGQLLKNYFYGCVGETVLLALENRKENFSIGRELDINKIEEIGRIGQKHGFVVETLYSFGKPVKENIFNNLKKLQFRESKLNPKKLISVEKALMSSKEEIYNWYSNHVNPILTEMLKFGKFDRSYVKGEGIKLWDKEGKEYYDFIGGYGAVNLGHNHPRIIATLEKLLDDKLPSLLQFSPGIMASALAENLALITPENLEFVFFCNSGTEANEGALKIARIFTGKSKIIYTENSFHGKTLGSLSVTGRKKYQKFFEPLLPDCISVPYGELEPLHKLLRNGDIAAFLVEPIQGEGGVIVPPHGYLKQVEELCKEYSTLMILDEVQTGFGRTGKMFAAEFEDVQPDIMTIAKSLGGGILPLGAYITTREIWEKAYGNYDRFLLHTSTFGGNNISTAVGITTIEVIYEENLIEKAKNIGEYFLSCLKKLGEKYKIISEVRGKGLMIGIEFHQSSQGVYNLQNEILSMIPVEFNSILRIIPEDISNSIKNILDEVIERSAKAFEESLSRYISSILLNDYNILTLSTLNNPNVMRIQPPLVISKEEVDYFVDSLDKVCQRLENKGLIHG